MFDRTVTLSAARRRPSPNARKGRTSPRLPSATMQILPLKARIRLPVSIRPRITVTSPARTPALRHRLQHCKCAIALFRRDSRERNLSWKIRLDLRPPRFELRHKSLRMVDIEVCEIRKFVLPPLRIQKALNYFRREPASYYFRRISAHNRVRRDISSHDRVRRNDTSGSHSCSSKQHCMLPYPHIIMNYDRTFLRIWHVANSTSGRKVPTEANHQICLAIVRENTCAEARIWVIVRRDVNTPSQRAISSTLDVKG